MEASEYRYKCHYCGAPVSTKKHTGKYKCRKCAAERRRERDLRLGVSHYRPSPFYVQPNYGNKSIPGKVVPKWLRNREADTMAKFIEKTESERYD